MSLIRSIASVVGLLLAIAFVFGLLVLVRLVSTLESPAAPASLAAPAPALPPAAPAPLAAPVPVVEFVEVVVPLCELTVVQLRALARSRGLRGLSRLRRAQLLELLS
jgi:hypothetical protein